MKLKNGNQTIRFLERVGAPYDMHNVGEVAGFPAETAALIIAAKTQDGKQAAVDYVPTSQAELAALPGHVRANEIDAEEAKKVVSALVKAKALNGDAGQALLADIDQAEKDRVAQGSKPATQADIAGILQQLAALAGAGAAPAAKK